MSESEEAPWADPDEAQRRMIERVLRLPREGSHRDLRDLSLLAAVTTAGPLALFALGVAANPPLAAGLGAMAIAAMGTSVRFHRSEHPRIETPATESNESRWTRASFGLIRGRHKPATESRAASVAVGSGNSAQAWLR